MQPNIRTRPSLTGAAETAARILESGGTISEAARASGVSRQTVYAWIKRGHSFRSHIVDSTCAAELARKTETNILARLAVGAIAQILSNDELPASVRARVALAVLERGNVDNSSWGVPEPVLELDAALPKPPAATLVAEARKLYNLTPELDANLTPDPTAARPQTAETKTARRAGPADFTPDSPVNPRKEILYTAA